MFPAHVTIRGTGSYLPRTIRPSDEIDDSLGWERGTCEARFAIAARHVADPEETSSFMAAAAAERALEMAGCRAEELDLIVGGCGVMEQPIPSTAVLVQDRLGLGASGIPAFDVNATCLGFLQALDVACLYLASGRARRALVFSADIASVGLDWERPEAAAIFGDGAAAVIVEAGGAGGILASDFRTFGHARDACVLAAGGTRVTPAKGIAAGEDRFRMNGARAFGVASRHLPEVMGRLLGQAGLGLDEVRCIIPHQASGQALRHARAGLGLRESQVIDIFARIGNQIAASIPTALDVAVRTGRLARGEAAVLLGTSAGISVGGAVVRF
jgi:3-oxoacyl-[acyl-carrier-protein] synthase III